MSDSKRCSPHARTTTSALRERVRRLGAVVEAGALTHQTLDLHVIAERIVAMAAERIGAERGSLFLLDRGGATLSSLVAQGLDGTPLTVKMGEGIVGSVARSGKALVLDDPYGDPRFDRSFDEASGFLTRSLLTVPVRDRDGELVAVLQLLNRRRNGFGREDVRFLAELGVPFALALETARQHRAILERERLRKELQLAADIQRALCPKDLGRVEGLELAVLWKPCLEVGGDYYDLIPGKDGSWWLVVADVSGKGVAAALIASNLQAFLWSRRDSGEPLHELAAEGNDLLHRLTDGRKYATLVLAEWRPEARELRWVNAGHPPMLLRQGGAVKRHAATGPPLGLIPGLPYACGSAVLEEGDLLLAITDGVTEASAEQGGEEFGMERAAVGLERAREPEAAVRALHAAVADFVSGAALRDDVTVLCARCRA